MLRVVIHRKYSWRTVTGHWAAWYVNYCDYSIRASLAVFGGLINCRFHAYTHIALAEMINSFLEHNGVYVIEHTKGYF